MAKNKELDVEAKVDELVRDSLREQRRAWIAASWRVGWTPPPSRVWYVIHYCWSLFGGFQITKIEKEIGR